MAGLSKAAFLKTDLEAALPDPDARVGRRKRARQREQEREKEELHAEKAPRTSRSWVEADRRATKLPTAGDEGEPGREDRPAKGQKFGAAADSGVGKKKSKRLAMLEAKRAQQAEKKAYAEQKAAEAAGQALKGKASAKVALSKGAADLLARCQKGGPISERQVLATVAERVTADPEKDLDLFAVFFELGQKGSDARTRQLALLSAVAVFQDLVPGYRIRELSEAEKETKLSKQVLSMQKHEMDLLQVYRKLLPALEAAMKSDPLAMAPALASLVRAAADFNYAQRLLGTAVKHANSDHEPVRRVVAEALQETVKADQRLDASREVVLAVGRLAQGVSASAGRPGRRAGGAAGDDPSGSQRYTGLRRELLAVLLHLPVGRAEAAQLRGHSDIMDDVAEADDEVKRNLTESSISHGVEHLRKAEAELLYEVFVVYLRILRQRHLHARELLATVLAGLARWGQHVNLELLLEILAELRHTVQDALTQGNELVAMQGLNCALVLLGGQGRALITDATWLADSMASALVLALPSLHSAHSESAQWPPPRCFSVDDGRSLRASERELAGALEGDSMPALVLRCLEAALRCPQGYGKASDSALAGLIERLFLLALGADPHVALAMLREASLLLRKHHRLHTLLDEEGGLFGLGGVTDKAVTVLWHLQALAFSLAPECARAAKALPTAIPSKRAVIADLFPSRDSRAWLAAEFLQHLAGLSRAPRPARQRATKAARRAKFLAQEELEGICRVGL